MEQNRTAGHLAALITIFIWGTTFISTKVLLVDFQPVEILVLRFVLGFFALCLAFPRPITGTTPKQEICFALAGLTGVSLYYLLENIALTDTTASNVGVIVSVSPFFIAMLTWVVSKGKETVGPLFFLGFLTAMVGIFLISFRG
ncbi:MAG: DMT family transporter, partial [Ruminiclostridium sp.]|nr:DMT family transporter [Ruminiclostridium sp.]